MCIGLQKSNKSVNRISLLLFIPAIFAFAEVLYLPHFTGANRFQEFLAYLNFRGYVFLLSFCVVAIGTIAILLIFRRNSWFPAILGISICCFAHDLVYT